MASLSASHGNELASRVTPWTISGMVMGCSTKWKDIFPVRGYLRRARYEINRFFPGAGAHFHVAGWTIMDNVRNLATVAVACYVFTVDKLN